MYFAIYSYINSSILASEYSFLFHLTECTLQRQHHHYHLHHHHQSIIAMLVSVHNSIGNVYQSEQRYDEALQHYHTSLDILRECLSADHPIIASIHNNRWVVLSQQQEYNSSKQVLKASYLYYV
jgi:hypothetical protein